MSLAVGTRIGQFEILDIVGVGGMGEVYRARDVRLSREVALKLLPHSSSVDDDRISRLEREARLLASLNHPNIAPRCGRVVSGSGSVGTFDMAGNVREGVRNGEIGSEGRAILGGS